jgi:hypothetical protein
VNLPWLLLVSQSSQQQHWLHSGQSTRSKNKAINTHIQENTHAKDDMHAMTWMFKGFASVEKCFIKAKFSVQNFVLQNLGARIN